VKLRKLSLLLIVTLCLSLVPAAVFASSTAVTLNAIASVQPGGSVVISGTSTLNEVIVKVVRPANSVVFYDIVQVNGGQFSSSFTLGAGEAAGTYRVIVGQADQVAAADLVVRAGGDGGSNATPTPASTITTPTPESTITTPTPASTITTPTPTPSTPTQQIPPPVKPTPTPTPASAPDKVITRPNSKAEPVTVDTAKNVISSIKAPDGHQTATVQQDGEALAAALAKAAKQDNHGDAPIVSIPFNNVAGEGVQFTLPSSALAAAAQTAPDMIISLQTNDGEYSLPLQVIDFASLAQSLGTTNANISIQVNISTAAADINAKIKTNAQSISTSQLGSAIEFSVTASGNGKSVELNHFGSTYVERSLVLAAPVDGNHATVVLYEPAASEFSFVPAVFIKQADGSTQVTFNENVPGCKQALGKSGY
jgi:hypothetical protein